MSVVNRYKDLKIWQRSMSLVTSIYALTSSFPKEERYGLTSQIRRCAVSVPSNIAEGSSRRHGRKEFVRFLQIAYGSLAELETQLQIALNLKFVNEKEALPHFEEIDEIMRMITGLMKAIDSKDVVPLNSQLSTLNSGDGNG